MKITTKKMTAQEMLDRNIKTLIWVNPDIVYNVAAFFIIALVGYTLTFLGTSHENYYANIP